MISKIPPAPTIETMMEVDVLELWTKTVIRIPAIKPTTGFVAMELLWNIWPKIVNRNLVSLNSRALTPA